MKSRTNKFVVGTFLLLGLFPTLSHADSLTLRDGRHVQGKFSGGTQGVIAFSVGGATQYYEVSNVLVMTFDAEGSDLQTAPAQQPSIVPDPGTLQNQKLHRKADNKNLKTVTKKNVEKKSPARLVLAAQRSE
jgi:hypothetical protein